MNHKRVRRLYRLEGLQLRMRVRRRKHIALHRGPAPTPTGPTERWRMDFVYDAFTVGRQFRVHTVVDQWSRQSPLLEVATAMSGRTVAEAVDRVLGAGTRPRSMTVDHGTEFTSRALEGLGASARRAARLHSARQAAGERVYRVLQRALARRVPERASIPVARGCATEDRNLAPRLQRSAAPRLPRAPDPVRVRHPSPGNTDDRSSRESLTQRCSLSGPTSARGAHALYVRIREKPSL